MENIGIEIAADGNKISGLDFDCVHDVLLDVEKLEFGKHLTFQALAENLPNYSGEQLRYAWLELKEGGYLDTRTYTPPKIPMFGLERINGLTFQGHEFLNTVRDPKIWSKTKENAKKAGIYSLNALYEVAQQVAIEAIDNVLKNLTHNCDGA